MSQPITPQIQRALQLEELQTLHLFQQICFEHNLQFYITAGTLLGAVRHNGFIPWDDDIDVTMPRDDFDRFKNIVSQNPPTGFFYQDSYSDAYYPFYFAKLRKNGTSVSEPTLKDVPMHTGIYIDIFPLDVCPQNKEIATIYFKLIELLTCGLLAQCQPTFVCGYQKSYMRLLYAIIKRLPRPTLIWSRDFVRNLVGKLSDGSQLCTVGGAHGYPYETYQSHWFQSAQSMSFESHLFPAPIGWDLLLKNMYGDYMTPPKDSDVCVHFDAVSIK